MNGPTEHGLPEWTFWGALVAGCGVLLRNNAKYLDPRLILAWLNNPTMAPIHKKLDRIQRVIDKIPGAQEAHEAVRIEDTQKHSNWE